MTWSSWFHINSRMVSHLRIGRLLLGGDAAHIHSPAGAQGMNTGIQDMINLGWKLALVQKGQAPEALLDTYEQERLPVMRAVLSSTDGLTNVVGSENSIVRSLFNHLGPWIGGADVVQEKAAAMMSQIAIGYRDSPLSTNHAHGSGLHAGDRVPDLPARSRGADGNGWQWQDSTLFSLLDPSRFTLLIAHSVEGESATAPTDRNDALNPWRDLIGEVELMPAPDDASRARFVSLFGRSGSVFLVRPDGYVAFAGSEHAAVGHLDAYCRRWLSAPELPG
jgi:hypothetical protein